MFDSKNLTDEELELMVPSKTLRDYIRETGWTFTDMEKAALLCHGDANYQEQNELLRELMNKTDDAVLKQQISEYLRWAEQDRSDCFEEIFYKVPNPFNRGDVVFDLDTEEYGIVENTQEDWNWIIKKHEAGELECDAGDVQIRVVFLQDDGTFSHSHVRPLDLELYQLPKGLDYTKMSARDNVLLLASEMYKGIGSLDDLEYFAEIYRYSKERDSNKN
jgi:hypothetical protein